MEVFFVFFFVLIFKNPVIFVEMNQKELMGNGIWVA